MKTKVSSSAPEIKLALTRKQTAAALGVSPITVDRLTKRKLLRPSRATRRPLYAVREIERFLHETTTDLSAADCHAETDSATWNGGANES